MSRKPHIPSTATVPSSSPAILPAAWASSLPRALCSPEEIARQIQNKILLNTGVRARVGISSKARERSVKRGGHYR